MYFAVFGSVEEWEVITETPKGYKVDYGFGMTTNKPKFKEYAHDQYGQLFNSQKAFHSEQEAKEFALEQISSAREWIKKKEEFLNSLEQKLTKEL